MKERERGGGEEREGGRERERETDRQTDRQRERERGRERERERERESRKAYICHSAPPLPSSPSPLQKRGLFVKQAQPKCFASFPVTNAHRCD